MHARALFVALLVALVPTGAHAVTLRYSLVIGNNVGLDTDAGSLPELSHAETEAKRLHGKLIERCSFDGGARSKLLLSPTKKQLEDAVHALAVQMNTDKKLYGDVDALFAFFFTGHGLSGRLLLADGPLDRAELGKLFKTLDPALTVGVIDACYSGSSSPIDLLEKGVRPTPGVNMLRDLPEEVLTAEGSVWFVSSGPQEMSYEDRELGGVFTHFFIEALEHASSEGPGITLDQIWHYVQTRTVAYTSERNRPQNPQQIVAKMKSRRPLYFSFPGDRDATLVLTESIAGSMTISYGEGWTEVIEKSGGERKEVAVYPGDARVSLLAGGVTKAQEDVQLRSGGRVVISDLRDREELAALGTRTKELWTKGVEGRSLRATSIAPGVSLLGGAKYEYRGATANVLGAESMFSGVARFDRGPLTGAAVFGFGTEHRSFPAWGYRVKEFAGEVRGGYAWDFGDLRLSALGTLGASVLDQKFDDGAGRTRPAFSAGPMVGFTDRFSDYFVVEVAARASMLYGPGRAQVSEMRFGIGGGISLAVMARLF